MFVEKPITGNTEDLAGTPPAQVPDGVVKPTPVTVSVDAEVAKVKAQYEKDINALKSSLQRQQSEQANQFRKKEQELQTELRRMRLQGLDEPERQKVESQMSTEDMEALRNQNAELQQAVEVEHQKQQWATWFVQQGVPADQLDWSSPDTLLATGWSTFNTQVQQLKQENERLKNPQNPPATIQPSGDGRPQAPTVLTNTSQTTYKPTWPELIKKYGSQEAVYRKLEQGLLDPNAIPE